MCAPMWRVRYNKRVNGMRMRVSAKDIVGYGLMWAIVVVIVLWADGSAEEHRQQQPITSFDIVVDDAGTEALIDAAYIEEWLVLHDMHPVGRMMADVDLARLEQVLAEHSAVLAANAYMTYDGRLVVTVSQRRAVARLRIDGYDMYVAADGYLFPATDGYRLSLPVITGEYTPLFKADYVGHHANSADEMLSDIDDRLLDIERRRVELLEKREDIDAALRRVEKEGVERGVFTSGDEYRGRVEMLKERKAMARRVHAEAEREIDVALRALEDERLQATLEAEHLRTTIADFDKLVAFVDYVCNDSFWRAEVVQIVISGGGDTPLQIAIVPRSGNFIVDMGYAETLEGKLATLSTFYDRTLSNVGWDTYKHISLRYDNQVVCR